MLISFREAADVSFQLIIAMASVACGMAIADVATKASLRPKATIDVSRSTLWASTPFHIDRHNSLSREINASVETASKTDVSICSDAIGLRIACDLLAAGPRRS